MELFKEKMTNVEAKQDLFAEVIKGPRYPDNNSVHE
jgi:hypothetical protein